jgi:hypothetical protein
MTQPARTPTSSIWPRTCSGAEGGRWSHFHANAKQPSIGKLIDEAMPAIEANPGLKASCPISPGARQGGSAN